MRVFLRYAAQRVKQNAIETAYRSYIADTLYFYVQGKAINTRWDDWVNPKPVKECDEDPEEIKQRIMTGLKGLCP